MLIKSSKLKVQSLNTGFTFVELILYVALIFLVFSSLSGIGIVTVQNEQKSSVIQEVGASGRYLSERIKREVREAKGLNTISSNSISLQNWDSTKDPTVIDYLNGNIRVKQGSGATIILNPNNTWISAISFTNRSSGSASLNIEYSFTINSATNSSQIYTNSMTVEGDAEVRSK